MIEDVGFICREIVSFESWKAIVTSPNSLKQFTQTRSIERRCTSHGGSNYIFKFSTS